MKNETVNIISIPPDKHVDITVGGIFYQRLNKLLVDFGDSVSKEELIVAVAKIQREKADSDQFAYNLETLMILIKTVEIAFKDAGFTEEKTVEIEVPDDYEFKDILKR